SHPLVRSGFSRSSGHGSGEDPARLGHRDRRAPGGSERMDALFPGRMGNGSRRSHARAEAASIAATPLPPPGSPEAGSGQKDHRSRGARLCSVTCCEYLSPRSMIEDKSVAVVIPCFRVEKQIGPLLARVPGYVDRIFVVDDSSPDGTAAAVSAVDDPRITLLRHSQNQGVGGAMATGYRAALEAGSDLIVKCDGDGQMDPSDI